MNDITQDHGLVYIAKRRADKAVKFFSTDEGDFESVSYVNAFLITMNGEAEFSGDWRKATSWAEGGAFEDKIDSDMEDDRTHRQEDDDWVFA